MNKSKPGVIFISLFTLILFACSNHNSLPTVDFVASPSSVPLSTSTVVSTSEPFVRQSQIEIVTSNAATGDGGNSWGGHQTRIVHTLDGVFTAYTVEGSGYLNKEWRLAKKMINGTWSVIAEGESGREPVNLLASPDGTLNIIAWPNGLATMWSGKPENDKLEMTEAKIPDQLNGNWPYNSAGIDTNGNICVLSSEGGETKGGSFYISCYMQSKEEWVTQTSNLDYRFCYSYIFPNSESLMLVSTRDVRWEALGYTKPTDQFDYVFNAIGFWKTEDVSNDQLKQIYFREETPTAQQLDVVLNAQQDAYLDTKGQMHIIYDIQGESTQGKWIDRHAIISSDGKVIYDAQLPENAGEFSRIFQDLSGNFYLLGSSGNLYPMGKDGTQAGEPVQLDLGDSEVEYSGFGLSVPRTGTPLSNVMHVVFPSGNESKWIYFQLEFSN